MAERIPARHTQKCSLCPWGITPAAQGPLPPLPPPRTLCLPRGPQGWNPCLAGNGCGFLSKTPLDVSEGLGQRRLGCPCPCPWS